MNRFPTCIFVYIMASEKRGTLYIGVTAHIEERVHQHKTGMVAGSFTAKYNVNRLVYLEEQATFKEAFLREAVLKHWKREWKIQLIEKGNSEWREILL
jgi:putative endonuclease